MCVDRIVDRKELWFEDIFRRMVFVLRTGFLILITSTSTAGSWAGWCRGDSGFVGFHPDGLLSPTLSFLERK